MRRRGTGPVWPKDLETCDPEKWAEPDAPRGEFWMLWAWYRWIDARIEHLRSRGYPFSDAQHLAASGDMPKGIDRSG